MVTGGDVRGLSYASLTVYLKKKILCQTNEQKQESKSTYVP